jgi:PAS domain S-box-containing protein
MTIDGTMTEANRLCLEVCGYTPQEVLGLPFWETPWWRGSAEVQEKLRAATSQAARGTPYVEILPYLWADGTERFVDFALHPVVDDEGHVIYLHPTGIDITERKVAEQALRESEERFRAIVETTPECVKLVARDGTIVQMNTSGLAIVGADSMAEIVGRNMYDLVAPTDREKYRLFHEKICDGETGNLDFDIVGLNGIARHMETHAAPFRMPDGTIVHLAVTSDVTERERAAEELRRSEDKLRTLAGELEIQVLTRTRELEERNQEVLRQSEQLRDLSNRLLQAQDQERRHIARELHDSAGQIVTVLGIYLARIGQNKGRNTPAVTKDVEECQQLVQQLNKEIRTTSYLLYPPLLDEMGLQEALRWYIQGLTDRTGLDIKFKASEGFGRLPREMELVVYRLVQECLTNIHRHSGSKTAVIDFTREGGNFTVNIQDSGTGIPNEKLKLLQSQGGGVGMRGMRERIRQFGGRMDIHSSESGTTISFTFQLPDSFSPGPENIDESVQAPGWNFPGPAGKDFAGADSD